MSGSCLKVESFYSNYGLFASRHPIFMIFLSSIMVFSCCYPLLNLPLPGGEPTKYITPLQEFCESGHSVGKKFPDHMNVHRVTPKWFDHKHQTAYIQQFLVKSFIYPQNEELSRVDMIKSALSSVYPVSDIIRNFKAADSSVMSDCFLIVDSDVKLKIKIKSLFPQHGCLIVSPASFWSNHNNESFLADTNILKTINRYEAKPIATSQSIKELLFGVRSYQTGIKSDKSNPVITYAITLVLSKYNPNLIRKIREHFHDIYQKPNIKSNEGCLIVDEKSSECKNLSEVITHIHFKPPINFNDLIPLLSTYFILGCYVYFSVRKINFVKSKLGMAFAAVVSIMASLMMSVGLCSLIGLTPTLNGGEIFPYLVCIIGLENILVITRSVVATPTHYDVERRISMGLSRQGCSIIKNILLEFVLIGFGYFTYIPEIQEFCCFALVGILSDFVMQTMFFVTVLSIDIRRLDVCDEIYSHPDDDTNIGHGKIGDYLNLNAKVQRNKLKKEVCVETGGKRATLFPKIPKRIQVVFFFADTRMVQRGLMVSIVIWFVFLIYSDPMNVLKRDSYHDNRNNKMISFTKGMLDSVNLHKHSDFDYYKDSLLWSHEDYRSFQYLSFRHWPTLFGYYNITLSEKFVSVLPSILLPVAVKPEVTKNIGKNLEDLSKNFQRKEVLHFPMSRERYQMTGLDYYLTLLFGAVSGMFMVFLLNIMYRCICSRGYGHKKIPNTKTGTHTGSFTECLPMRLIGHNYFLDCLHVEGTTIISSDLSGQVRTWDLHSGDCTSVIKRNDNRDSSMIWCVASCGQLVVLGCDTGRIEVWNSVGTYLKCFHDIGKAGIVKIACEKKRIVAARMNGTLDFFVLEGSVVSQVQYRGTPRTQNDSGFIDLPLMLSMQQIYSTSAHHQPISALKVGMGRVVTGSRDQTLKLFAAQDGRYQFTMVGHSGAITDIYIDETSPPGAASGSEDGSIRLWDLMTGSCSQLLKGHTRAITAVQCSQHHVLSTAEDNDLCVWAKGSGLLLQVCKLDPDCFSEICVLGHNWCVTGGMGALLLWDIRSGELLRRVDLFPGESGGANVTQVSMIGDLSAVCNLGHDLCVVRFPSVLEKID